MTRWRDGAVAEVEVPGGGASEAGRAVVEVRGLRAGYGGRIVLEDVTFSVFPGQRVAVVGPNGAGKSTLFNCIAGLLRPTAGTILLATGERGAAGEPGAGGRRELAARRPPVLAYAPQREAVNWHFPASVYDVVMMGRFPFYGPWRSPRREDRQAVMEALGQMGLAHLARTPIQDLSGGQQQRVFLARALAQQARLLILDEPFNAVEEGAQAAVVEALSGLREKGVAVLLSTHDLDFVAGSHWFDRVMVLNGRILAFGPPEAVCAAGDACVPSAVRPAGAGRWAVWAAHNGQGEAVGQ